MKIDTTILIMKVHILTLQKNFYREEGCVAAEKVDLKSGSAVSDLKMCASSEPREGYELVIYFEIDMRNLPVTS